VGSQESGRWTLLARPSLIKQVAQENGVTDHRRFDLRPRPLRKASRAAGSIFGGGLDSRRSRTCPAVATRSGNSRKIRSVKLSPGSLYSFSRL
jgi:hypothetical protein